MESYRALQGAGGSPIAGTGASALDWDTLVAASSPFIWAKHDEAAGPTLIDSGSYVQNGTYQNSPTLNQTGIIPNGGTSVLHAGTSYGSIAPKVSGDFMTQQVTFETVVNLTSLSTMALSHTGSTGSSNTSGWVWLIMATGEMRITGYASGWFDVYSVGAGIVGSVDTHLAVVIDQSGTDTVSFYKNGALVNSVGWGHGPVSATDQALAVGGYTTGGGTGTTFKGVMDDWVFYKDTVLTAPTLLTHAEAAGLA